MLLLPGLWLLLCLGLSRYARQGRIDADERHPVHTADGWTIWLHRFRPRGQRRFDTPIILGHGLMMNRHCWSLSAQGSLPRALAERGHDVWVAEYRGSGMSRPPAGSPNRWTLEDHVASDLPALIATVRGRSSADAVHWIGHSMGGIVAYMHACRAGRDAGIARLVTIGSPVGFKHVRKIMGPLGIPARRLLRRLQTLHIRPLLFLALPYVAAIPRVALRISGASEHLNLRERITLVDRAFEDSSSALAGWFLDRFLNDELVCPRDGCSTTGGGFADLDIPTLVIAGQRDVLAPPGSVRRAFDETEGIPAAYRVFGDPEATLEDTGPALGHADLISGEVAMRHVLPLILGWLEPDAPTAPGARLRGAAAPSVHPIAALPTPIDVAALEP